MQCARRRKTFSPNDGPLGRLRTDQDRGEFGQPLYLSGFEEHGCRLFPVDGSETIWQCVEKSAKKFPSRRAVGWRDLVKVHQIEEGGKKFEKLELSNEFSWLTYSQYLDRVGQAASGLQALTGLPEHGRVVIYAETQRDWMVSAVAAFRMSLQVVTIYATLGRDGALFGFQQTKASIAVVDAKLLKILVDIAPQCDSLKHLITLTPCDASTVEKLSAAGITVTSFDELCERGRASPVPPRPPQKSDIAVIMYTSGTTAAPKGVLLSHANIVGGVAGFQEAARRSGVDQEASYLAYLPLAHIMEMVAELSVLSLGAALGYGTPHTLIESSVKLKRPESDGDAVLLQPTFMVFAPAVLDKVYKGVLKKVEAGGALKKYLFDFALQHGLKNYEAGIVGAGLLNFAFSKVQAMLGGRISLALTGSAPLAPEIQQFIQTVLNCPVRQGYGLTETCACATIGTVEDGTVKDVGPPCAAAVIRLADWAEGGYMNSDRRRLDIGMARGEVLVGGPAVAMGYLVDDQDPDPEVANKNETEFLVIDGVRFFRTGDIGQITPSGTLQIIDRKKDLWKGPQGEYVALSKVESALKLSPYVEIPMVYGRTGASFPVALICPNEPKLRELAEELGIGSDASMALCKNPRIISAYESKLLEVCKQAKLVEFEIPKKIALVPGVDDQPAWTPENDMLTAALKLKRPMIAKAFATDLDTLYN